MMHKKKSNNLLNILFRELSGILPNILQKISQNICF